MPPIRPLGLYESEDATEEVEGELRVARFDALHPPEPEPLPAPEPVVALPPPPPPLDPLATFDAKWGIGPTPQTQDRLSAFDAKWGDGAGPTALDRFRTVPLTAEAVDAVVTRTATARPGLSGDIVPNQFDSGLSTEDAYAACGPVAAVAFARRTGRNPTVEEAKNLAREVGWTPERGMAGPRSQKALLDKMGIPAVLTEGAPDWTKVQQDVQSGNPVTLSTPGHYFVAAGYDEQTGRFDFGHSGTALRGGRRWMTPAELAQTGQGAVTATLFLDNPETPERSVAAEPSATGGGRYDDVFRRYADDLAGDPQFIAVVRAGTKAESGENPDAVGDNGESVGLFQMHARGAGAGMGDARRDPDAASAVMVPKYARFYKEGQARGLAGAELASYTARMAERPQGWDDPNSQAARNYKAAWGEVAGSAGETGAPLPAPPPLAPPPKLGPLPERPMSFRERERAALSTPETPLEPTEPRPEYPEVTERVTYAAGRTTPTGDADMGVPATTATGDADRGIGMNAPARTVLPPDSPLQHVPIVGALTRPTNPIVAGRPQEATDQDFAEFAGAFAPTPPVAKAAGAVGEAAQGLGAGFGRLFGRGATEAARTAREGFAGNIRLGKYDELVRPVIQQIHDEAPERFEAARRGVVTDAEVRELAQLAGANADKALAKWKPGQTQNAETIHALRNSLSFQAERVIEAQQAYKNAPVTGADEALLSLTEELTKHRALQEVVSGVTAEAGRSLRVFRQNVSSEEAMLGIVQKMAGRGPLGRGKTKEQVAELLRDVDLTDPEAVALAAKALYRPQPWDRYTYYLYNALLSNPQGRIRDAVSTAFSTVTAPLERAAALPFDVAASAVTGRRTIHAAEVPAEYAGMAAGLHEGIADAFSILRRGFTRGQAREELEAVATREAFDIPFTPTRFVGANDAFFKAVNGKADIYAGAIRTAKTEGLKGDELAERVAFLRRNPTDEMLDHAESEKRLRVFQEDGSFSRWVSEGKNRNPFLRLLVPFHQTAINLGKYSLRRSPLGYAMLGVDVVRRRAGQREIAEGLARATLGTALTAYTVKLVGDGLLTGAAPEDENERDAFYRSGKQPFSVNLGGEWRSYQYLPIAQTLSVAADIQALINRGEHGSSLAVAAIMGLGIGRALSDQPYMQGIENFMKALADPPRYAQGLGEQAVRMHVPQAIQWATRATDAIIRDPDGPIEAALAGIPGLSRNVPARYSAFGRASRRPEATQGVGALDITRPSPDKNDPVEQELERLQKRDFDVQPGFVSKKLTAVQGLGQVELDRQQWIDYQKLAGQLSYAQLAYGMQTDAYQGSNDHQRAAFIDKTVRTSRDVAANVIRQGLVEKTVRQAVEKERRRATR